MIAQVHQTATAWRGMDPEAAACAERIRTEVRQRYGIDLPDPAQAASEAAERIEDVTAGAVLAGTANAPAAQPAHDSEQRRRSVAQALAGHPDREAVAARLIAEKHQGTPPGAAVGSRLRTVGWARRAPVFGRRRGVGRDETAP
jgi:colicin import membrane protein